MRVDCVTSEGEVGMVITYTPISPVCFLFAILAVALALALYYLFPDIFPLTHDDDRGKE